MITIIVLVILHLIILSLIFENSELREKQEYHFDWIKRASQDLITLGLSVSSILENTPKEELEKLQVIYDRKYKEMNDSFEKENKNE